VTNPSDNGEFIKIAYYYYKTGMTQNEIAKKMSMSRQRVNRILKKCLETGIVKISIQELDDQNIEFEARFEAITGLNEATILNCEGNNIYSSLGPVAASYLERILKDDDIIGFSRGRALSTMVHNLVRIDKKNLTVTQLVGGLNAEESSTNSDNIVRHSSEILNAKPYFMYTPIIVENRQLRDSMLQENFYAQVYNKMKSCTVAVVGIGDMSNESEYVKRSFLTEKECNTLRDKNAVGEICTHYFDINGNIIRSDINGRVFAIDYNSFKKIPIRIGISGGKEKIPAIEGAIRGKLITL
jgi:DNA-binding transcriptional regulator LsrR (DeoR family)